MSVQYEFREAVDDPKMYIYLQQADFHGDESAVSFSHRLN